MADPVANSRQKLMGISPCFLVEDVVKTAEYYRDVLGFHFKRYWGEPPCFVILLRDSIEISFNNPGGFTPQPNRRVHPDAPWDVYIWVADLASIQEELQAKGAKVTRGPEDTFYNNRELEIEDSNGYVLCFGQNLSP